MLKLPHLIVFLWIHLLAFTAVAGAATVRINEFMASNGSTLSDEDGDFEDWIELFNFGDDPVDLNGFGLTDNLSNPYKWIFPEVVIQPGQYLIVWASGKNRRPAMNDLGNGILREVYNDISGFTVSDLTNHPSFPDFPTSRSIITSGFEAPSNVGNNYGQRMRAWLRPPFSGNYRFYIASDDASVLRLSTDDDPANAVDIASVPDWTEFRQWDKYSSQSSALINLQSNTLYYIEALMKEGQGLDHLSVGWSLDSSFNRPMSGHYLFVERELHTSWGISAAGEPLQLTDSEGNVIDMIGAVPVPRDMSYGRSLADSNVWHFFAQATPGGPNLTESYPEILAQPELSHPAGFYTDSISVTATTPVENAVVRYTLDGTEPTESSPILATPLNIASRNGETNNLSLIPTNFSDLGFPFFEGWQPPGGEVFKFHTLRVRAFRTNAWPSRPLTQSYIIDPAGPNRYSMPVVSVVADPAHFFSSETGIYVQGNDWNFFQSGSAWERPGSVELFEANGTPAFNIGAGIRLHGGTTRNRPRKSLRIYAREPSTLNYQLFPDKPILNFDTFILRNSGNDWGMSVFRDAFLQSLTSHTDLDRQYSRPAIVFINGEYWGIHPIRDRFDDGYMEHHYALGERDFTQIEALSDGSNSQFVYDRGNPALVDDFQNLLGFVSENDLSNPSAYHDVAERIDIPNFIDYFSAQIFFGNTDWPGNNMRIWRSVSTNRAPTAPYRHDGRWRWMLFDTDFGFGLDFNYVPGRSDFADHNTLAFAAHPSGTHFSNRTNATLLFRRLLENSDFKRDFVLRFADQLNTVYSTNAVIPRLQTWIDLYTPEMHEHTNRWRQPANWTAETARLRDYGNQRTDAVWGHLQSFFNLGNRVSITVSVDNASSGSVKVNTLDISSDLPGVGDPPFPWVGSYFTNYPVTLEALPSSGFEFNAWVDGNNQVVSTEPVFSFTPGSQPALTATFQSADVRSLIHYWNFNDTQNLLDPTLSLVTGAAILIDTGTVSAVLSGTGQDFTGENARFGDPAGAHLRLNDPIGATQTLIIPTIGFTNILVIYETRRSGSGAGTQIIDFTTDGLTFTTLSTNIITEVPTLLTFDLSSLPAANNNSNLALRITFEQGEGGTVGNNRFDNLTVEGYPLPGINLPPEIANPLDLLQAVELANPLTVDLSNLFSDPENDPLTFTASSSLTNFVATSLVGSELTLAPLQRGDSLITVTADDGNNPPVEYSFRLLVYPAPFSLEDGDFSFGTWDPDTPERVYPEHMLFLQSAQNDTDLNTPLLFPYHIAHNDYHTNDQATIGFPYNNTGRSRINGLDDDGISFINTGSGRDLGGALLALDTRNLTNASVAWLGGTLLANTRVYAIRLQWRTSLDDPFTDLLDENENPVEYLRNNTGHTTLFDPVALPPAALDQPNLQLLWRYYRVSGTSGARAQLRLDDILIGGDLAPVVFSSVYPTMFIRGSFNGWANDTQMTLIDNYTWQIEITYTSDPNPRFKFDAFGDWHPASNYGDNPPPDGIADPDGANIVLPDGNATYRITFNDQTKAYIIEKLDQTPVFLPGGTAPWNNDANWTSDTFPNATNASAIINQPATANRNVDINAPIIIGHLTINNGDTPFRNRIRGQSLDNPFTFAATNGPATLAITGTGAGFVEFEVLGGVNLHSDLAITVDNIDGDPEYGALRLRQAWAGPGGLLKSGPGQAALTGSDKTFSGPVVVEQGVLALTQPSSPANASALTVLSGGQLRLTSANDENGPRDYVFGGTLTLSGSGRSGVPESEGYGILGALRYEPGSTGNRAIIYAPIALATNAGIHVATAGNELELADTLTGSHTLAKSGGGALLLTTDSPAFTGNIQVENGILLVAGRYENALIDVDASLQGFGQIGPITGSGLVEPGPGPAILTAASLNGPNLAFQFTQTGSTDFSQSLNSLNDLLRLRDPTPFPSPLDATTRIDIYLTTLSSGDTFLGGFFTDVPDDFLPAIEDATLVLHLADPLGPVSYEGQTYSEYTGPLTYTLTTVEQVADFIDGTLTGRILQLSFSSDLTPFQTWQNANFTEVELLDPDISGPLADPDLTTIPNLLRFALGLDRNDSFEGTLPRAELDLSDPLFIYRRLIDPDSGIAYEFEIIDDLLDPDDWREAVIGLDLIDPDQTQPTGDGRTEEVTLLVPANAIDPLRAIRLRIRKLP
ncbi:MAG TPA: CotH kinase family protein [Kiritimatiellia bacterium]|nr:CotH kinase family protein [Kiritimatiellia bacterium]